MTYIYILINYASDLRSSTRSIHPWSREGQVQKPQFPLHNDAAILTRPKNLPPVPLTPPACIVPPHTFAIT